MDKIILDIESHIDVLYSDNASQEERMQADSWIRDWQYSDGVFEQCFAIIARELSTSNINSRLMFVSIKVLQERIRYSFKKLSPELIGSILECLIGITKINVSIYESKNQDNSQSITITPQLQFALMSICDLITMSSSNFFEIAEAIPDCLKMLFLALFFEESKETYHHRHVSYDCLIQHSLVEYGIEVLKSTPMSVEWMRCFGGIVSIAKSCEMYIPLIPRLPETITNIETISILLKVLRENIYSVNIVFQPFIEIIIEFNVAYSQALRQLAVSEPQAHIFLQGLWSSFFTIDAQCDLYKNIELLMSAFQEFFEVTNILQVDVQLWKELLTNSRKMISECESNEALDKAMEPIKIAFFRLCSRQYMNLLILTCNYTFNQADDLDNALNISEFGLSLYKLYDEIICNLNTLSKGLLNQFLLNEEQKTYGILKIAGLNAQHIEDHALLCKYAQFALECIDDAGIFVGCSFINSAFKYVPEYIIQFISYTIQVYPAIPLYASESLCKMSKKFPESFLQADPDILNILINLLKYGRNPTKAHLILTILNVIVRVNPLELANPILEQISSYCVQFANAVNTYIHYLKPFVSFITYMNRYPQDHMLDAFYNALSISMINALGIACMHPNCEVQEFISIFFESLIINHWLSDLNIVSEYIQHIIENGVIQYFHIDRIILLLPLEIIPPKVFELCNNAFIPINTTNLNQNNIDNLSMNVNFAKYKYGTDEAENIVDSITSIIKKVVLARSFQHLALFSPLIFTEIILRARSKNPCNNVYDTIIETIQLCQYGEVPHEILVCILNGCTKKAFRCERHQSPFLLNPMKMLGLLMTHDEYVQLFLAAIPAAASQNALSTNGNNPAMNYLNVINNPSSTSIDCSIAIDSFKKYYTMTAEQSIQ